MPRIFGFVAILICAAIATFGGASAQIEFPGCDTALVDSTLKAGNIPDFRHCPAKFVMQRITGAFGERYQVVIEKVGVAEGFEPGTVARQRQEGREIRLTMPVRTSQAEAALAQPSPPPPAVNPAAVPAPGVVPVTPPPPVVSQRVSFSIADAAPVEEGKPLTFRISRSGDDGRAHEIRLSYSEGRALLASPPSSIHFEPGEPSQKDLVLQTDPGLPGDGEHRIEVLIAPGDDGASIGLPRAASGTITDAPLAEAAAYQIELAGPAVREQNLTFTVSRAGPLVAATVPYRIEQDGSDRGADLARPLNVVFREGERNSNTPIVIPPGPYSPCGGAVTVTLPGGAAKTAEFAEPPPSWCYSEPPLPWWKRVLIWMQDNWPAVLGGGALVAGIVAHHVVPKPTVDVEPSLDIEPGGASFQPLEEPVSRWPKFSADVTVEPGETRVTQPLPRLEPHDG